MEERVKIPVSLPRDNPTVSYWQDQPDDIADLRTTLELPEEADIAIIGSGISGASVAYNILSRAPSTNIVMLEARQACSGATGRNGIDTFSIRPFDLIFRCYIWQYSIRTSTGDWNANDKHPIFALLGGHTKAASYTTFLEHVESLGLEEAIKVARLEYNTISAVHAFAKEKGIPCDSTLRETVDIVYDQEDWDTSVRAIELMRKSMPGDPASKYTFLSAQEAEERFLCKGAIGAITYEAGSVSAYKFVIGILRLCLERGLNLQTGTPVTALQQGNDSEGGSWMVTTPRVSIRASKVVLATNAYTAAIYPKLHGMIVPLRGQITAHRPGSNMPKPGLGVTYSFRHSEGYDYMIPCPQGSKHPGCIIIGGGYTQDGTKGLSQYGSTDDTVCDPLVSNYLTASTARYFGENWGPDDPAGRIRREWTGIMGYSADGCPLIGELPGENGLYIMASFQGHGMVLCFLCARALTHILFGDDENELYAWFPRAYKVTPARMKLKFDGSSYKI
ncbi:hypothetical protein AJ80_08433 [Polytolypa hystricis UAMH7299]|uniref:FAD dependent oxidoreductase domain-containing protein n=1 Tax=Polytolypa hystricis (strain UAMH7299) TaxID=1447883 RepID=A0A2B7WZU9_POLH7|nr:hypothetical protein AJ80_08433 [Polytolypa hystricis UAMH7299]